MDDALNEKLRQQQMDILVRGTPYLTVAMLHAAVRALISILQGGD